MTTIHVIDFEGNKKNGINEFGVVTLDDMEISHVTSEKEISFFGDYLQDFLSLRRTGPFCAHSAQTEDNLLRHYWASPGSVPTFTNQMSTVSWGPWIDTKIVCRKLFKNLSSYELPSLISTFQLEEQLSASFKKYSNGANGKYHNALYDAIAAALLLQNIQKSFQGITLQKLVAISQTC